MPLIFFFLLMIGFFVNSQTPYSIKLNQDVGGLPSNKVFDIYEDSEHFIWIASETGISRFDGKEFKNYKNIIQTSYGGSCLREDIYKRIWYENFDGFLYCIDENRDSIFPLKQNKPIHFINFGLTTKFLFVFQQKGLDIFDLKTLDLKKTIKMGIERIESACTFQNSYIFFYNDTLIQIDEDLAVTKNLDFTNNRELVKLIYTDNEFLYIISKQNENKKIYQLDKNLRIIKTISIQEIEFLHDCSFIDGLIWLSSPNGTYVYEKNGKLKYHYFQNQSTSKVLKDYQNNYWFSSTNEGIKIVTNLNNTNQVIPFENPTKVIKLKKGVLILNQKKEFFILEDEFRDSQLILKCNVSNNINYVFFDSLYNDIYFTSDGVYKFNLQNPKLELVEKIALKELFRLDSAFLIFTTSGFSGLWKTHQVESPWNSFHVKNPNSKLNIFSTITQNNRGKTVAYDPFSNKIYLGTNVGLFWQTENQFGEIKMNNEPIYALKLIYIQGLLFILCTKGNLYLVKNNFKPELLNVKMGIPELDIQNIKVYNNFLYIQSNHAIYEYNIMNQIIKRITPTSIFNEIRDFLAYDDKLILLNPSEIISLKITNTNKKITPNFLINSVKVVDEIFYEFENLTFENYQNYVSIKFSILDYGEKSYDKLEYSINNSNKIQLFDNITQIDLPLLAPGNYVINFYLDGQKLNATLKFTILVSLWKRWWFLLSVLIIISSIIYFYYKLQTDRLRKKLATLNEKIELEKRLHQSIIKTIKSQMNPHFFYNALNTIQAFIFTEEKIKAHTYLAKFSKLTRQILEQSEKDVISLQDEINTLNLYLELEKMRFPEDFSYMITENIKDKDLIFFPPMIIQPYLENAIKHGLLHKKFDKKLNIEFQLQEGYLNVIIEDNGIGRAKASELKKLKEEKYASFSTKANEKRLNIINNWSDDRTSVEIIDKFDQNQEPNGTKVIINIKISEHV